MKIVTAAEMREIDRITTEKYGLPSLALMENAGSAVARFALEQYPDAKQITVVCGKGNNGGDGFVAARKLLENGREVTVLLLASPGDVRGDAQAMLRRLPLPPRCVKSPEELASAASLFSEAHLVVDAIFGTGFRPPLTELAAQAIELISRGTAPVVAVDIPSGVDADSFDLDQPHICRSDAVGTFTALKPGIIFPALTRGPIVVANIGSPAVAITSSLQIQWNGPTEILRKQRPLNSNKGLYGHALIIGGSLGKSGAPTMASAGALRIGAGLVTCAVPSTILPVVAASTPEWMTEPLDETTSGVLSRTALRDTELSRILERKNVVAIGPGLGREAETVNCVKDFVRACSL